MLRLYLTRINSYLIFGFGVRSEQNISLSGSVALRTSASDPNLDFLAGRNEKVSTPIPGPALTLICYVYDRHDILSWYNYFFLYICLFTKFLGKTIHLKTRQKVYAIH
jgi:hypothetical protein